jgi:hypothetical protein
MLTKNNYAKLVHGDEGEDAGMMHVGCSTIRQH